jgi:hypothetical protein
VKEKRQSFMQRAEEDETDQESFGLDQFAARIHLGKPSGSAFDSELQPILSKLIEFGASQDEKGIKAYLETVLKENGRIFDKIEVRGRLLWTLLRSYGATLPQHMQRRNIWCAMQLTNAWSHGERAGYLWGVFVDAVNKSELVGASESLWEAVQVMMKERPEEFAKDEAFLLTARLAGLIDSFAYDKVEPIIDQLANCVGPDLAGWAFTRCLAKSLMIHRKLISKLPLWDNNPLKNVNLRAGQFAPLLADVGCVEEARNQWMADHMDIYKHGSPTPGNEKEARMELEHLRAGLLVFARFPRPEAPYDQILAIILKRFEQVLLSYPHLSPHNHGLLYALTRADYYNLANRLAQVFLKCGSDPSIVSSAMIHMCTQNLDSRGASYWVARRQSENSFYFRVNDRFNDWVMKSAHWPVERLIEFPFPTNYKLPLKTICLADTTMRQRLALGKLKNASPSPSNMSEPSTMGNKVEESSYESAETVSSNPDNSTHDEYLQIICRPNPSVSLVPITEEQYLKWDSWLLTLRERNLINLQDVHSMHKIMLSFTVAGKFKEAEDFLLSNYRNRPAGSDVAASFLAVSLAEHGMFTECIAFMTRLVADKSGSDITITFGYTRFFDLFQVLQKRNAPASVLLELWSAVGTADTVLVMAPTLINGVLALGKSSKPKVAADGEAQASSSSEEDYMPRSKLAQVAGTICRQMTSIPPNHHKVLKIMGLTREFIWWLDANGDRKGASMLRAWIHNVRTAAGHYR